ncbi:MAG: hypothetical protein HQM08_25540 [Candidatus Riflebacteria bacterium]|nr:hypothetical protein [Candidatus Riflebacteria bacterium]
MNFFRKNIFFCFVFVFSFLYPNFLFSQKNENDSDQSSLKIAGFSGEVFFKINENLETISNSGIFLPVKSTIKTGENGKITLSNNRGLEIRVKENSVFSTLDWKTFKLESGLAGFKSSSNPPDFGYSIGTKHFSAVLKQGIITIKANDQLSRLAVLKGWSLISSITGKYSLVNPKEEIAGGESELSEKYLVTDELYFAHYWN